MSERNLICQPSSISSRRRWALLWLPLYLGFSVNGYAGELRVEAPVVNVETIAGPERLVEVCPEKPSAGLSATLRWDLGISCATKRIASEQISGYRVFYRWDNRVYSQVMDRNPGTTIPLSVSLD
jgi:uncharacterized protein YcfJ